MQWKVDAGNLLLTPEQVAERLCVSIDWVRDHSSRKNPRLPVIRVRWRSWPQGIASLSRE
jgi:hypothetical protein